MTIKTLREHQTGSLSAIASAVRGIVNLPTGTGKTLIQSRAIMSEIQSAQSGGNVYVIVSPRILLSNQILENVRTDLMLHSTDAQYLVVHSGSGNYDAELKLLRESNLPFRETANTTSTIEIRDAYNRAVAEGVPLVISSTYHSFERIRDAGVPLTTVYCDEAHYLVTENFSAISEIPGRAFFFTATMRNTASEDGIGMNNVERFGEVIYSKKPVEMIEAGEIVRPRLHLVDMKDQPESDEADALAVVEAFKEHRSIVHTGAKLLVVAKGVTHLNAIVNSEVLARLRRVTPNLTVFDISSEYEARINGETVTRSVFFKRMQNLTDADLAIIIHIDILAEGIDVPGITGVMPFNNLKKSKFLQTLGRATRLHNTDRARLYSGEIKFDALDEFVKPYSYVVVPVYGSMGDDLRSSVREMILEMRGFGFNPSEDIVVKASRGKLVPAPIGTVNELVDRFRDVFDFITSVIHDVEEAEEADALCAEVAGAEVVDELAELAYN